MAICCMSQETQTGALDQPRGVGWGGRWEGGSNGEIYVYLCLIHVDIWQKTSKSLKQLYFYNYTIILFQLKKIKGKKKGNMYKISYQHISKLSLSIFIRGNKSQKKWDWVP